MRKFALALACWGWTGGWCWRASMENSQNGSQRISLKSLATLLLEIDPGSAAFGAGPSQMRSHMAKRGRAAVSSRWAPTVLQRPTRLRYCIPAMTDEGGADASDMDLQAGGKTSGRRIGGRSEGSNLSKAAASKIDAPQPEDPSKLQAPFTAGTPSGPEAKMPDLFSFLKAALGRIAGGGLLGIAGGSAVHAAVNQWTILGGKSFAPVDPFFNLIDLGLGFQCGLILGGLWAWDAAFLSSGAIQSNIQQAIGAVLKKEDDAVAGERALLTIKENVAGNFPLRIAFFLTGLDQEPAVAKLIEEAEVQRDSTRQRPMSEIIALLFQTTLEAKLGDARLLVLALSFFAAASIEGLILLLSGPWLGLFSIFGAR